MILLETSMLKSVHRSWIGDLFVFLVFAFSFSFTLWGGNWKTAVILDEKGRVVYADHPDLPSPPASTVKVLTAMVVIDHLPLEKWVRVSEHASKVEPSKCYLKPGEEYRVKDLIYALLMASANDAAVVLAEAVAGSEKKFAVLMNAKARRCGARRSHFVTASGLPAKKQVATARDLARIMRIARYYGLIVKALSKKVYLFRSRKGRSIRVVNHNKLLWDKRWNWVRGKTGFTSRARQCFLGFFCKRDRCFSFCFLGGATLWDNIKELIQRVDV